MSLPYATNITIDEKENNKQKLKLAQQNIPERTFQNKLKMASTGQFYYFAAY